MVAVLLTILFSCWLRSAASSSTSVADQLGSVHWLLSTAEEIHRSFLLVRDVQVLRVTASGPWPKQLCARQLATTSVSRKQYEESWTSVFASDSLDAIFNGTCFTLSADSCAEYSRCATPAEEYREEVDPATGLHRPMPEEGALEGTWWAFNLETVKSWQMEQAQLVVLLDDVLDDNSEQARYLREQIIAAAGEVDLSLRLGTSSLVEVASSRVAAFQNLVSPGTAPSPRFGAPAVPQSLQTLAGALDAVAQAARLNPCNPGHDWAALHAQVIAGLQGAAAAVTSIDAQDLLTDFALFDYTWRVVEALSVGTALAFETVGLAELAKFECVVQADPRSVSVADLEPLRAAAFQLFLDVTTALPEPMNTSEASYSLRRCFAQRLLTVRESVSDGAAGDSARASLLSLDLCGRIFEASSRQLVAVAPYLGAIPTPSSMSFYSTSGEQRTAAFDGDKVGYIGPYASIEERPAAEVGSQFAAGDKVVSLHAVDTGNVRAVGSPPDSHCTRVEQALAQCNLQPPCQPGCHEVNFGMSCSPAAQGQYSSDGATQAYCDYVSAAHFYMRGWPNSSCPFDCAYADQYPVNRSCVAAPVGTYSPTCNNTLNTCSTPDSMPSTLFRTLVAFTTSGQGSPQGCEATLAFPLVHDPPPVGLVPPFTVELWIKIEVSAIPSASPQESAILCGTHPLWYFALRRASETSVQLAVYHASITTAASSREDSLVNSEAIPWSGDTWHHIAVKVTSLLSTSPNIFFYADGSLVSSARRSTTPAAVPPIPPSQLGAFHVGPPNMQLFPTLLDDSRREPYYNLQGTQLFYEAQIDEVRVHAEALEPLAQGVHLTELRRRTACDSPFERLEGSTCQPPVRLTAAHALADRSGCEVGFETCGSRPGACVAACRSGMVRQGDCTCTCPPGKFRVWLVRAIHFTGSGTVRNITVYDDQHRVVAQALDQRLDLRLDLQAAVKVAVITIRGGASATEVAVDVETAAGERQAVPDYRHVQLLEDRDVILHHRRHHEFFDSSLACADCPGNALGSTLPREDALSCSCADGYGRTLLGLCAQRGAALPQPLISPSETFHTAGTRVRLAVPPTVPVEGPWLLEIRYEVGEGEVPAAPSCTRSPKYVEVEDGRPPGLDIIKRARSATVRAILCHPLHFDSPLVERTFTGNDHLDPPLCNPSGTMSTDTAYAMTVTVSLTVDDEPDAAIHYQLGNASHIDYVAPVVIGQAGITELHAWATKGGFDTSMTTLCRFEVDGPARAVAGPSWAAGGTQLGGWVHEEAAFLVLRDVQELRFAFWAQAPQGLALSEPVQLEYRIYHRAAGETSRSFEALGSWVAAGVDSPLSLPVDPLLWAAETSTTLRLEWRVKETGYVWTNPQALQLILLATQSVAPTVEAVPSADWGMGDTWAEGPLREAALRQVHRVVLQMPVAGARLVFAVAAAPPETELPSLLDAGSANVSTLAGGLQEQFVSKLWSRTWGPDQLTEHCTLGDGSAPPELCDYLGPFEVLADETVIVFALQPGKLESEVSVHAIPRDVEPPRADSAFQAPVVLSGPHISVSSAPGVFVLPSLAETITFSLGQSSLERQSCVLASLYHLGGGAAGHNGTAPPQITDCSWLPYQGQRSLERSKLYENLGLLPAATQSLNITILTTVKREGYLWAYPHPTTFLYLRNQAEPPSIVSIIAPGVVPAPAAMVWLQPTLHDVGTGVPECVFSVHFEPIASEDVDLHWLHAVPPLSVPMPTIPDAMQPTALLGTALSASAWLDDVKACAWPALCQLPLNGFLPADVIKAPADLPWVCAWVLLPGLSESQPSCTRIGLSHAKVVRPTLDIVPPEQGSPGEGEDTPAASLVQVGTDPILGATILMIEEPQVADPSPGSRRLSAPSPTLALNLERTHPLQFRHASVSVGLAGFAGGAEALLQSVVWSGWQDLGSADPTPEVSLPSPGSDWPAEHALLAVEVRLLLGVNSWTQPERSLFVVLTGRCPTVTAHVNGRSVTVTGLANSTILYRWMRASPNEPRAVGGTPIHALSQSGGAGGVGISSISDAFALEAGVQARLQPLGSAGFDCVAPNDTTPVDASEVARETTVGPRLCIVADAVQLATPDEHRWFLWVAAMHSGLALSPAYKATFEAQCIVATGLAGSPHPPSCREGGIIDSGSSCSTQCEVGHSPSEAALLCRNGSFTPSVATCLPDPCPAPTGINHSSVSACLEGDTIEAGRQCTVWCLDGFSPTVPQLDCLAGSFESSSECIEDACSVAGPVSHAATMPCAEGAAIAPGGICTVQCENGYIPSAQQLSCSRGRFSPASFTCREAPCEVLNNSVAFSTQPCREGWNIPSGSACTAQCDDGYVASEQRLSCSRGSLSPPSFTCEESPCTSPSSVQYAGAPACREGWSIPSGSNCTAQCDAGYMASEQQLLCNRGVLSPSAFICQESPCSSPSGVRYASTPACQEGKQIAPGGVCTPQCQSGFAPSELQMSCVAGQLQPGTFACDESPCAAPASVENGAEPVCAEGLRIVAGGTCTTRCQDGFQPSQSVLTCGNGSLVPATYSCKEVASNVLEAVFLIGGIVLLVALLSACAFCLAMMYMREHSPPPPEEPDVVQEWLNCTQSTANDFCIFCKTHRVELQAYDTSDGKATLMRFCGACGKILANMPGITQVSPLASRSQELAGAGGEHTRSTDLAASQAVSSVAMATQTSELSAEFEAANVPVAGKTQEPEAEQAPDPWISESEEVWDREPENEEVPPPEGGDDYAYLLQMAENSADHPPQQRGVQQPREQRALLEQQQRQQQQQAALQAQQQQLAQQRGLQQPKQQWQQQEQLQLYHEPQEDADAFELERQEQEELRRQQRHQAKHQQYQQLQRQHQQHQQHQKLLQLQQHPEYEMPSPVDDSERASSTGMRGTQHQHHQQHQQEKQQRLLQLQHRPEYEVPPPIDESEMQQQHQQRQQEKQQRLLQLQEMQRQQRRQKLKEQQLQPDTPFRPSVRFGTPDEEEAPRRRRRRRQSQQQEQQLLEQQHLQQQQLQQQQLAEQQLLEQQQLQQQQLEQEQLEQQLLEQQLLQQQQQRPPDTFYEPPYFDEEGADGEEQLQLRLDAPVAVPQRYVDDPHQAARDHHQRQRRLLPELPQQQHHHQSHHEHRVLAPAPERVRHFDEMHEEPRATTLPLQHGSRGRGTEQPPPMPAAIQEQEVFPPAQHVSRRRGRAHFGEPQELEPPPPASRREQHRYGRVRSREPMEAPDEDEVLNNLRWRQARKAEIAHPMVEYETENDGAPLTQDYHGSTLIAQPVLNLFDQGST